MERHDGDALESRGGNDRVRRVAPRSPTKVPSRSAQVAVMQCADVKFPPRADGGEMAGRAEGGTTVENALGSRIGIVGSLVPESRF